MAAQLSSEMTGGEALETTLAEDPSTSSGMHAKAESPLDALPAPSPAELVAKARAPVKKEFLRSQNDRLNGAAVCTAVVGEESRKAAILTVSTTKKSKRQQKRERQQAKKSAENICNAVAKANDVNACPYRESCRFNHDLEAFLAQKPPDLPGGCPCLEIRKVCPYGAACRFAGMHQGASVIESNTEKSDERNTLRKELQKRLWKNQAVFPRADAQLLSLGIMVKGKQKAPEGVSQGVTDESLKCDTFPQMSEVEENGVDRPAGGTTFMDLEKSEGGHCTSTITDERRKDEEAARAWKKSKADSATSSPDTASEKVVAGPMSEDDTECRLTRREKKLVDFRGKLYVAPLTTVGNLPFRRVCKQFGADITCGEMAMCTNLLQGQVSEWALLRRHSSEDLFGVQICGAYPDTIARTSEMIERESEIDFIDINVGCPIDLVVNKGAGSCLLTKPKRLKQIVMATSASIDSPLTIKVRTGYFEGRNCVQSFIADVYDWGACALTIHGRTRQQRYSKLADWEYIYGTSHLASEHLQVLGNGDIFSYTDWNEHMNAAKLSTCMLARGVLIKPWLLTEIKEQRHWDISASERFDALKDYVRFGLQHWGSDAKGVETTRHFLLEWLSYMHRYIPTGLLEIVPQKLNWRPPLYYGRNDLETLMASDSAADWVRISEMLLGPPPASFSFSPRHKSNAYDRAENG